MKKSNNTMDTNGQMGRLLADLSSCSKAAKEEALGDVTDWAAVQAYATEIKKIALQNIDELQNEKA